MFMLSGMISWIVTPCEVARTSSTFLWTASLRGAVLRGRRSVDVSGAAAAMPFRMDKPPVAKKRRSVINSVRNWIDTNMGIFDGRICIKALTPRR